MRRNIVPAVMIVTMLTGCAQDSKTSSETAALSAEVALLKEQLGYLKDRQQIHDTYLRYMRGFDRNDVELMRSAFWPDVQINYGAQSNTFEEFVTRHLNLHTSQLAVWGHLLTNETVDLDGDVAHVETYVTALWMPKDEKSFAYGKPIVGGRYIDRVERRNGEWRIAMREFVPHFQLQANTDPRAWETYGKTAQSVCARGTWDKRDPSYRRPLTDRTDKAVGPACAEE